MFREGVNVSKQLDPEPEKVAEEVREENPEVVHAGVVSGSTSQQNKRQKRVLVSTDDAPKDNFVPKWKLSKNDNVASVSQAMDFFNHCFLLADKEKMDKIPGDQLLGNFYRQKYFVSFFFF